MTDIVDHPPHYTQSPRGTVGECYDYARWMTFPQGNAFKYVWRAGQKGDRSTDLRKALWYLQRAADDAGTRGAIAPEALPKGMPSIDPDAGFQAKILWLIAHGLFEAARDTTEWFADYLETE